MTQEEVLQHVLSNDCTIYDKRMKDDGIHYWVRRNGTKKLAVIYPVAKNGYYTEFAICHICQTLGDIAVPEYAKKYEESVQEAKSKVEVLEQFPSPSRN